MKKKIIIGSILAVTLIGVLCYVFLNRASAALTHNFELVSSNPDTDGYDIVKYNIYFTATGSTEVNHVEGSFDIVGYDVISFDVNENFETEDLDTSNYSYSLTSNKVYDSSDGKVVYATITLKENGIYPCHVNFIPGPANLVKTNDVTITKDAVSSSSGGEIVTEVSDNEEFYYKITVKNDSVIATDDVVITDTIPGDFEILDADGGSISGQTITWNIGSMDVDEEQTFYVKVKVISNENRQDFRINNTATVTVGDKEKSDDAEVEILYSEIDIVKEASVTQVKPGQEFTYTITVTNHGTGPSEELHIIDFLDSDVTLNSANPNNYQSLGDNSYEFHLDSLDAGESATITLYVTLNANTTKTSILNEAIACEGGQDDWEKCLKDEVTTPIVNSNIVIEKTASEEEVRVGDTFTYTIKITNTGDAASNEIIIRDIIDSRLDLISASEGNVVGNTWTMTIESLKVGGTITVTLTVKVNDTANPGDVVPNTVTATEEGKDPVEDEDDVTIVDSNVTIEKSVNKSVVNVGEEFIYTITIRNTSDVDSKQITVTDTIDSSLTIKSAPNGSINGNTITYNVGILKGGESRTYNITVVAKEKLNDNTVVHNVAVLKEVGKPDKEDDVDITVVKPILSVEKNAITTTGTKIVQPNEEYEYEIIVKNTGNGNSNQVVIKDTIDSHLTIVDADGGTVSGQTITWNVDSIKAGETITYRIKVRVNNDTTLNTIIPNEVIVTHDDEEYKDDDDVTVIDSDIYLNKVASVEVVDINEEFYYTITVSNKGTADESNLTVTDQIPSSLSVVNIEVPENVKHTSNNNLTVFTIDNLPAESSVEIKVHVRVRETAKQGEKIINTAVLTYDDGELESSDDVIVTGSLLSVEKTSSKQSVSKGEELTYTITIQNKGTASANNVEVIDTFDEYLEIIDSDSGIVDNDNHTVTWNIASIASNETIKYTITARVREDINKDVVNNHVIVKEPGKPDEEDEVDVDVVTPTFTITKEVSKTEVTKGEEFEYFITVKNTSNANITNLLVTDEFDPRLIIVENDGAEISGNTLTWTFDLAAESSITFTVRVKVAEDISEGEIPNIATATYNNEDTPSNEVIVKIIEIENPQTGNIMKYSFIFICIAIASIIIIYTKKKGKIFKI